jgi:lysophospholipid acyltransferase (LPLAT)-like uncharacterized protein
VIKAFVKSPAGQRVTGTLIGGYLKLVAGTARLTLNPADLMDEAEDDLPFILTAWHGEHLLLPMLNQPQYRMHAMVSRHRDGELNAIALKWFDVDTIRGAGSHKGDIFRKGGFQAYRGLMTEVNNGACVFMTGDVPKVARAVSPGLVKLAAHTGRPIYPMGIAVSPFIATSGWDRAAVPVPFGRVAITRGKIIRVGLDADEAAQNRAHSDLKDALDEASARAWQIVGKPCPFAAPQPDEQTAQQEDRPTP